MRDAGCSFVISTGRFSGWLPFYLLFSTCWLLLSFVAGFSRERTSHSSFTVQTISFIGSTSGVFVVVVASAGDGCFTAASCCCPTIGSTTGSSPLTGCTYARLRRSSVSTVGGTQSSLSWKPSGCCTVGSQAVASARCSTAVPR